MANEEEEIEFKPLSVRELLTEMKDLSEIMIDLAYSAILFNDSELMEEVLELEERIDSLSYLLLMNAALAVRDKDDAEQMVSIMKVASATDKISDAAGDIATTLRRGADPRLVVNAFVKAEERLTRVKVSENSTITQKTLDALGTIDHIGVDVIAVRRGQKLIINPDEKFSLKPGDVVIARGSDIGIEKFKKLAEGKSRKVGELK
ncbi:MAG: potassium channel family protein [Candidatus Jordarchaeum sp.]|uniref:potassium channel family protein n=1 Tax=Candidatus Jordarchaeum sp. TaxID=2823881 RepID=UPI00404B7ED2